MMPSNKVQFELGVAPAIDIASVIEGAAEWGAPLNPTTSGDAGGLGAGRLRGFGFGEDLGRRKPPFIPFFAVAPGLGLGGEKALGAMRGDGAGEGAGDSGCLSPV